ncbi:MAG: hypothetical protein BVN34_02140 [Proteobacteria bacterium ST_bin12]|nr:MAG: hypothetical protein BVN34_02140 [Proteobacteria bacterium ST_bin12]
MNYLHESHRNALLLLENNEKYAKDWSALKSVLDNITDTQLIDYFTHHSDGRNKSLSVAINRLLKDELVKVGFKHESPIFQETRYRGNKWRLDFVGGEVAVEVAFNHGEATAWNLIKPNLSGELNHVKKDTQTEIGILITATQNLKTAGGFDSAVGTYQKFLTYLKPMQHLLPVPMLIIGLDKPTSFKIKHKKEGNKKLGIIEYL